jgi:hypothetical protein
VGDALNDLPTLDAVGIGFLLGNAVDTGDVPECVVRINSSGPRGFSAAAARVLAERS